MFDPAHFIPNPSQVKQATNYPAPYELAWQVSHSCESLTEAIRSVSSELGITYDLASSLVWAEMLSQSPLVPA